MKPVQVILAVLGVGLLVAAWLTTRAKPQESVRTGGGGGGSQAQPYVPITHGGTGTASVNGIGIAIGAGLFNGMEPPSDETVVPGGSSAGSSGFNRNDLAVIDDRRQG